MSTVAYVSPNASYRSSTQKRNLAPSSVVISWTTGETNYSLTDDGAGNLTGDGDGTVSYATGVIFMNPNPAPTPRDGDYTIEFEDWQGTNKQNEQITLNTEGTTTFTPAAAMREGSVEIDLTMREITKATKTEGGPVTKNYRTRDITLSDDGNGNLRRDKRSEALGSVNYATGEISFDARMQHNYTEYHHVTGTFNGKPRSWYNTQEKSATETYANSNAMIRWTDPGDPVQVNTTTRPIGGIEIDVTPTSGRRVIPNSVIFELGGNEYRDRDGTIIRNWSPITDAGDAVGSIDYTTGLAVLDDFPANTPTDTPVNLIAAVTTLTQAPAASTIFRTAGSPLREGSLIVNATNVNGEELNLDANTDGSLSGDVREGFVDTQTGLVSIEWGGTPVVPETVRYSAVSYTYLPLDADLVGLDATRLPSDGRVPQFNTGDVVVISNTEQQQVQTATAGDTVTFNRVNQAEVWVEGDNGNRLAGEQYTEDPEAGTLTFADPLSLVDAEGNAITEPLTIYDRVEDMALATEVQIGGQISLNIALSQDYTAGNTIASAALLYGDLRARTFNEFHQKSWDGSTWMDERQGDDTTAKYNLVAHPIEITNQGAIKERWAIRFTTSGGFDVIGETVGVIANGNTTEDLAVTNPATGAPYFTIRSEGWGSGWVSGNTLRFNTDAGQAPFWVARTVVAGRAEEDEDQFSTQNRGDAD